MEVGLVFVRKSWVADVTLRCVEGKVEAGHYEGGCLVAQRLQTPDMVEVEQCRVSKWVQGVRQRRCRCGLGYARRRQVERRKSCKDAEHAKMR